MSANMSPGDQDGLRVLVTGAARGLGASHARLFAERGHTVIAADIDEAFGTAFAAECRGSGLDVHFARLDVTLEASWIAVLSTAEHVMGGLDVLVNNAGIAGVRGGLARETRASWDAVLAVNATGVFLGMSLAVPLLRRSGRATIVNIASMLARIGDPSYLAYCASKGAVTAMTRSAALELAPEGIRVNAISPGEVRTDMNGPDARRYEALTPLGRMADPREISELVYFVATRSGSFMTGSDVVIDGGFTAR